MPIEDDIIARTELKTYVFGHSLINHASHTDQTTVPYWMDAFADAAGLKYAVSGQFGQLEQHVQNLPPTASWPWRFDGVDQAWDHNSQSFAQANFDSILITPANYIQILEPTDRIFTLPGSAVSYTAEIIDWVHRREPGADVYIYENWPDMRRVIDDNIFPATDAELRAYHELTMGEYAAWFDEYHAELQAARPDVNIISIPVGPMISQILTETSLSGIPIRALYEDIAPHGTETLYFLASVITYSAMYGTLPPADFDIPNSVHPLVARHFDEVLELVSNEFDLENVMGPGPVPEPVEITGGAGDDDIDGGAADDVLRGAKGDDNLRGGTGDDSLFGGEGNDTIRSGAGADRVWGGSGKDKIGGGTGDDRLSGGAKADKLDGGAGADFLIGGKGADVFIFDDGDTKSWASHADTIADFGTGNNDVDLRLVDANTRVAGDQSFDFSGTSAAANSVWYKVSGNDVIVYADNNGDGIADLRITVLDETRLNASDFLL